MTASVYVQKAQEIFPIYGVSTIDEAKRYVPEADYRYLVETDEAVYMNVATGSVGFASDWEDLGEVVEVDYSAKDQQWVQEPQS